MRSHGKPIGEDSKFIGYADEFIDVLAFDVTAGNMLAGGRLFAVITPGIPDGLKIDSKDRLYSSSFTGGQVFNRSGKILGEVLASGVANFCFGRDNGRLFMMCDTAINIATIAAKGA